MNPPQIVSAAEWEAARKALLVKEKQATPARDVLAAERRRLPMVRVEKDDRLQGPNGEARLVDLFDRRRQLIVYQFMFAPGVGGWPDAGCDGCSLLVDNVGQLAHLHARDTSLVLVSRASFGNIQHDRERMGWTIPWFSSAGSDFNIDLGLTSDAGETFGLSVLLRDGEDVVRTYFPNRRGTEALGSTWRSLTSRRSADRRTCRRATRKPRQTFGGAATTSTTTPRPQRSGAERARRLPAGRPLVDRNQGAGKCPR
jgi:predicted dithiol-disulfide oxidoreductase (DUF899 family)